MQSGQATTLSGTYSKVTFLHKLLAFSLAFLFLVVPLAPVWAEKVTEDPSAISKVESTTTEPEIVTENSEDADVSTKVDMDKQPPAPQSFTVNNISGDNRDKPNLSFPQVDQASGGLAYSYPLNIPPGRNGFNPNLTLQYSSQDTDQASVFGYGWSINIPYIKRLNKTGVEKLYTTNYFTSSLSGELVNVSGSTYAPKVENGDFLKYNYDGTSWIVTDKKGTVYKFGTSTPARQDDTTGTKIYKWMLEEARDTNNNFIKYEYYKDTGQIYPETIKYTGNDTTNGVFSVSLIRSGRNDNITQNSTLFSITTNYKISEIQTITNGTWNKKYILGYSNGDNGYKSLITSITESGQDENANVVTLPPVQFTYQVATTPGSDFVSDFAWSNPVSPTISTNPSYGAVVADVNSDGLPDIMESYRSSGTLIWYKGTYLNNGNGTWTQNPNLEPPTIFGDNNPVTEQGIRAVDLNADGFVDLVQSSGSLSKVYINTGTSWVLNNNWIPKCAFASPIYGDIGCRLDDINGDDLPDFFIARGDNTGNPPINTEVYLNNGNGWSENPEPGWSIPADLRFGTVPVDYNGDGLLDFLQGYKNTLSNPTVEIKKAYKNNGDKTWSLDGAYTSPVIFATQTNLASLPFTTGALVADVNGDGLVDILHGTETTDGGHLNKGTGWSFTPNWDFGHGSIPIEAPLRARLGDFDGDGMIDYYESGSGSATFSKNQNIKADLIKTIKNQYGGISTITYKGSTQYKNGNSLANPNLPFNIITVSSISSNPSLGGTSVVKNYTYEQGDYYYNTILDRKYAGFGKIIDLDSSGAKTASYFHQGNETNSSLGEYDDHPSKIGKIYRTEIRDSSGNLYESVINKWEKQNLGPGRDFAKLARTMVMSFDGNSDNRSKAEEYSYDSYGNLTQKISWGEVIGATDGTFTDLGNDKFTENISYVSNTGNYVVGLPSQDIVLDQNSDKVRETKMYYDGLAFGSVGTGNETKLEKWKSGSSYVNTQKSYNITYGILTSSTDERGKVTTYSYDSYNLYPISVTNPALQIVRYLYDYSLGKPKQLIDQNSFTYQTIFDGLDRVLQEKVPDLSSPDTLVVKTAYTYADTSLAVGVLKTDYLDSTNSVNTYQYFDGLNRLIQERKEAEQSNSYNTRDIVYNNFGLIQKESLPYASNGYARTNPTTDNALYTSYSYDAQKRISNVANAVGNTSTNYDDWKTSITDPNGKIKHFLSDGYDNLVKVEEINAGNTYNTYYEWDGNKFLTKITDALANVRNFTYDGLGRRLTAEDLHAMGDSTYGTWAYTYDDAGNLTRSISPETKIINYSYDDINRLQTEDYVGGSGMEISYVYDNCTNGIGKLCSSTVLGGGDNVYTYDSVGNIASDQATINENIYLTSYSYDRQNNLSLITYPDNAQVKYIYNAAGLLEKVERKENSGTFVDVISNFDYNPTEQVAVQADANGITTTNTYDSGKLYRLTNKKTLNSTPISPWKDPNPAITPIDPYVTNFGNINITPKTNLSIALQDLSYIYDNVGNIIKIIDSSNTTTAKTADYVYDDLYRLVSATITGVPSPQTPYIQTFTYDAIGNITSGPLGTYLYQGNTGVNYANPHATTSIGGVEQTYDKDGNLISAGDITYSWNYKGKLAETLSVYNYYNAKGDRVQTNAFSSINTYYPNKFYSTSCPNCSDRQPPDQERQIKLTKQIYIGDTLVATTETLSAVVTPYYDHTDQLGSITIVSDANKNIAQTLDYYPYGKKRVVAPPGDYDSQRQYIGQIYDLDTGLNYLNARYYDGNKGQFISQDPMFWNFDNSWLLDPQNMNAYSYARGNPMNRSDPGGMASKEFNFPTFTMIKSFFNSLVGKTNTQRETTQIPFINQNNSQKKTDNSGQNKNTSGYIRSNDVNITFSPGADNVVNQKMVDGYKNVFKEAGHYGIISVNFYSTTNHVSEPPGSFSWHDFALAGDINMVNGMKATEDNFYAKTLQEVINRTQGVRENFGPFMITHSSKIYSQEEYSRLSKQHQDHLHTSFNQ